MHPIAVLDDFIDKTQFPYFNRMASGIRFSAINTLTLLYRFLNWENTAIIYSKNRGLETLQYNELKKKFRI